MADHENDVIAAVVAIMRPLTGLRTVYDYMPVIVSGDEQPAAYVWISKVDEKRLGLGGIGTGKKWVDYTVKVELHALSHDAEHETTGWHQLLNQVRKAFRTHQTLSGLVQRFGEDIDVDVAPVEFEGQTARFAASVSSTAREEVTG